VIETDGWRHHRSREAFEADRRRHQPLARAGHRTLRFTHRRPTPDPAGVAATLEPALRRA
jgi:very-short-patch-repair endonuclease